MRSVKPATCTSLHCILICNIYPSWYVQYLSSIRKITTDPYGHVHTSFGSISIGTTLISYKCSVYELTAGAQRLGKPAFTMESPMSLQVHIRTYAKACHYVLQVVHLLG